jgi:UrcA family protein
MTTSKLTTLRRTLAFAGAFAAIAIAPVSFAATQNSDVPSIKVRYNDLNLTTSAGVDALYTRIARAANAVCPIADIRDLAAVSYAKQCQVQAIARAVQEVNNTKLAVVHAARVARG